MKNEEKTAWDRWLDAATHSLRLHPDLELARQELLDHLEDKTADLQRIFPDLTQDAAKEMALEQMGDPEEIDRAMEQAHSKLWGTLYWAIYALLQVTKLAMVLILPLYLWLAVFPLAFAWWPF